MTGATHSYIGKTAIAGIGATEFSKASGRSELRLAAEAVDLALRDAGIEPSEVDGMVTFSSDTNPEIEIAPLPSPSASSSLDVTDPVSVMVSSG